MSAYSYTRKPPSESTCRVCGRTGAGISRALGVCRECIIENKDGAREVGSIARFLASLDPDIPYSLLAFHPDYLMDDMGTTTARQA
jgi:pyruvate-formate lyase-activating enzyme